MVNWKIHLLNTLRLNYKFGPCSLGKVWCSFDVVWVGFDVVWVGFDIGFDVGFDVVGVFFDVVWVGCGGVY